MIAGIRWLYYILYLQYTADGVLVYCNAVYCNIDIIYYDFILPHFSILFIITIY